MKSVKMISPGINRQWMYGMMICCILVLLQLAVNAQDGNAGILEANKQVRSYFVNGTKLMYAVGAIVGLIGAVKVLSEMERR